MKYIDVRVSFVLFCDFCWFICIEIRLICEIQTFYLFCKKSFHLENDSVLCTKLVKHKERLMCAQTMSLSSLEWFFWCFHFLCLFFSFIIIIMNYESSYKANNGNDDIFTSIHSTIFFAAASVAVNHVLCKASHAIL